MSSPVEAWTAPWSPDLGNEDPAADDRVSGHPESLHTARWTLAAVLLTPREARRRVADWMSASDIPSDLRDNVILVCSELVTNVVLHAVGPLQLSMRREGIGVMIEVCDHVPDTSMPTPRAADQESTSGRGLTIVETVSSAWGVTHRGQTKTVWALVEGRP